MVRFLFLGAIALLSSLYTKAQCEDGRYRDMIFQNVSVTSDILYGSNIDYLGEDTDLYLDVYQADGDGAIDRPLIVVAHGGSFVSGSKTGTDVVPLCQDLARMGYVVASIQYRLGIPVTLDLDEPAAEAVLRGVHDSRAAIRFFRKNVVESGNTYNIDPDKIYMAGVSAGGFNALHVAYLDEENEIPDLIDQSQEGLGGGIEGLSGNPGYSSSIAGVVNIAGAVVSPDIINSGDAPVCSFHGTGDSVVPFGSDVLTFFGVFEVDSVHGSNTIHQRAEDIGLTNCFQVQWLEGHVPHVSNALHYDTLRSITSNFLSHLVCPDVDLDCEYREVGIVSSINEFNTNKEAFDIWPNPTKHHINIRNYGSAVLNYTVLDLTGQQVLQGSTSLYETKLLVENIPNGIYLIQLENDLGAKTLRFNKTQ